MARNRGDKSPSRRVDSGHAVAPLRVSASPSRRVHVDHQQRHAAHPLENPPNLGQQRSPKAKEVSFMPEESWRSEEEAADKRMASLLNSLRDKIRSFTASEFDFIIKGPIEKAFVNAPPELISYVGCIAIGGPNGREGWRELIENVNLRKALVFGIVSRAVQEHVLSSLCFGASYSLTKKLLSMEAAQVQEDGFLRSQARAEQILQAHPTEICGGTPDATARVTLQLRSLLQPIRDLNSKPTCTKGYTQKLYVIVDDATALNFAIRSTRDVIYHFPPVFKDEEFEPKRMHCENLPDMQRECPLENFDTDGKKIPAPEPRGDPTDVALVRVVCSLGCVAYRKGGGDLAKELLAKEETEVDHSIPPELRSRNAKRKFYGREITEEDGVRSRTLSKAVVALRWGKPQFEDVQFAKSYKELVEVKDEVLKIEEKKPATGCVMM